MEVMEVDTNRPDIIQKFHNLDGVQIGEKRKNLYKWLKCTTFSDEDKNVLLFGITPQSYLEELFKLEILMFFKRTNELLDIMKDGNEVFISKIIKEPWFFQEAFKTIDGHTFVNEFLPCLSYSMRAKVLGKVSRFANETQMDDIFSCLLHRYGLFISKPFLTRCSNKKIEDFLKTNDEITLSFKQCKELYNKNPNLFLLYLDNRFNAVPIEIWKYIANNNFDFFLKVQKKFGPLPTRFGKRSSKTIIKNKTRDVIDDICYYKQRLNKSILIRKLKPTYKQMLIAQFNRGQTFSCLGDLYNELRFFPKKVRWEIFSEIYTNATKKDILQHLNILESLIYGPLLPSRETQIKWAKIQYKYSENVQFLQYFDFDEGFTFIKEKINVTSDIRERQNLLIIMLLLCKNNGDLKYLEKVLEYIGYRHKNEKPYERESLLQKLANSFELETLEEIHWKHINDQIELLRITDNIHNYNTYVTLLSHYLIFLCRNNKPYEDELKQFVQDIGTSRGYGYILSKNNFPEIEKKLLVAMSKYIITGTDVKFEKVQTYVHALIYFNTTHKEHFLNIYEITPLKNYIINIFSKAEALDKEYILRTTILNYNIDYAEKITPLYTVEEFTNILKSFKKTNKYIINQNVQPVLLKLIKNPTIIPAQHILDIYFTELFVTSDEFNKPLVKYIFKHDLLTVQKYFDLILNKSFSERTHFLTSYLNLIKKCSHLQLDSRLLSFCKNYLEPIAFSYQDSFKVEYLFLCYSKIHTTEDFKKYIEKYLIPTEKKLDLRNEEQKKLYRFQCSILNYFKHVIEPSKMLSLVVQYFQGDYLQSALCALYTIFYHSKETILPIYIDILAKRPLSAQKHALFLTAELLNCAHYTKILTYLLSQAKSNATKKHLFKSTFRYFVKNPSDELFNVIIENMQFIDQNDQETLQMLCTLKVPKTYQLIFIERYWLFLENLEKKEVKIYAYISPLFAKIKSDLATKLNFEFVEMIIRKYFFIDSYSNSAIELAFWTFIKCSPEKFDKYMAVFFNVIEQSKCDFVSSRTKTNYIFSALVSFSEKNTQILQPFSDRWKLIFDSSDYFEENLLLDMLKIKYENFGTDVFLEKIVSLLEQLVTQYDLIIVQIFSKLLQKIIKSQTRNSTLYEILTYKNSRATCLLAIDMAVDTKYGDNNFYSEVVNIVKNSQDPLVKIFYREKLL